MDGRNKLKAHWPPRRIQTVQVQLDAGQYEKLYEAADANKRSLAAEIRAMIDERAWD